MRGVLPRERPVDRMAARRSARLRRRRSVASRRPLGRRRPRRHRCVERSLPAAPRLPQRTTVNVEHNRMDLVLLSTVLPCFTYFNSV